MAIDTLLWGNTRPRIRVGTSAQTNGTNYVLNQPTIKPVNIHFPKQIILNESVLDGTLTEHIIGRRGIFTCEYEYLDRPSCEYLIDIFNSSSDKYMRPNFNFWKEYKVRIVNTWELDEMGKSNQPYMGTLVFETISLESSIPSESSGSFSFNGSTKVADTALDSTLSGDMSVEMWIKTPSSFGSEKILFEGLSAGVDWTISIQSDGTIRFRTDDGSSSDLDSSNTLSVSTWYHLVVRRVNTDDKYIVVNGTQWETGSDSKAANAITGVELAATSNGFDGLAQILRVYNDNISSNFQDHMIEAMPSAVQANLKLWWDFSQGSANDLSAEGNDGIVTGTTTYYEESFPDKGYEIIT